MQADRQRVSALVFYATTGRMEPIIGLAAMYCRSKGVWNVDLEMGHRRGTYETATPKSRSAPILLCEACQWPGTAVHG